MFEEFNLRYGNADQAYMDDVGFRAKNIRQIPENPVWYLPAKAINNMAFSEGDPFMMFRRRNYATIPDTDYASPGANFGSFEPKTGKNKQFTAWAIPGSQRLLDSFSTNAISPYYDLSRAGMPSKIINKFAPQAMTEHENAHALDTRINPERKKSMTYPYANSKRMKKLVKSMRRGRFSNRKGLPAGIAEREAPAQAAEDMFWDRFFDGQN